MSLPKLDQIRKAAEYLKKSQLTDKQRTEFLKIDIEARRIADKWVMEGMI